MSQRGHTHRRSMRFRRKRTTAHRALLLTIVLRRNMRWRRTAVRRYVALRLPLVTALPCSTLRHVALDSHVTPINTARVTIRPHGPLLHTRCSRMRAHLDLRALRVLPVMKIKRGARVAAGKFPLRDAGRVIPGSRNSSRLPGRPAPCNARTWDRRIMAVFCPGKPCPWQPRNREPFPSPPNPPAR
jgi:hypothetical protein